MALRAILDFCPPSSEQEVLMSDHKTAWCSWCAQYSAHQPLRASRLGRDLYRCEACELPTLSCRYCDNMARAAIAEEDFQGAAVNTVALPAGRLRRLLRERWHHLLCAEHDGSVADFRRAAETIAELKDFKAFMRPRRRNLYALGRNAGLVAGGAAAVMVAPAIAAAFGAVAAKTATGAVAATSLSMAKAGVGRVALMAAGASLGGRTGYSVARAYFKDIPDYDILPLISPPEGSAHRVVVVNGFLTHKDHFAQDWLSAVQPLYPGSGIDYLNWESKNLRKLGQLIGEAGAGMFMRSSMARLAKRPFGGSGSVLGSIGGSLATGLIANPWHSAMVNAEKAGLLLAEAISRTEGKTYTLMGHSLGARVVLFALKALAAKGGAQRVDNVLLMAAAVDCRDQALWQQATAAVSGRIYNCFSTRDAVLRYLYRAANAGLSHPAGLDVVQANLKQVVNVDCSDLVTGHSCWKERLPAVLDRLELKG